jgi:hypothetical protein
MTIHREGPVVSFGALAVLMSLLIVAGQSGPSAQQPLNMPCATSPAAMAQPHFPFHYSERTDRLSRVGGDVLRTSDTREQPLKLLDVPADRYLTIDSIAIKGTHPTDSYLAIELITFVPNVFGTALPGRHFLYARDRADAQNTAVHIREPLSVVAMPRSSVLVGFQYSTGAKVEAFSITVTGVMHDCRLWGK